MQGVDQGTVLDFLSASSPSFSVCLFRDKMLSVGASLRAGKTGGKRRSRSSLQLVSSPAHLEASFGTTFQALVSLLHCYLLHGAVFWSV